MRLKEKRIAGRIGLLLAILSPALLFTLLEPAVRAAQDRTLNNPLAGNPSAVKEGASLFRANCSPCHGLNARGGGRGPDLTSGRWTHGSADSDLFHTITTGVPGTQMPSSGFEDSETWSIIAYVRSLAPSEQAGVPGDAARGESLFNKRYGCASCHMVNGTGGILGPDLSRVGASRSVAYMAESIREPDKELSDGMLDPNNHYGLPLVYDTTIVALKDGTLVTGVACNEDTFSLQLIDSTQHIRLFQKRDLQNVRHERKSLMFAYSERMMDSTDLQDLIAYMVRLRGR